LFAFTRSPGRGALLRAVCAPGLSRRLHGARGGGSFAPLVAFGGLLGTAFVSVMGSGLDTEFTFALMSDVAQVDPANAALYNHWIGTIPWLWGTAGLTAVALGMASRAAGYPRWLGLLGYGIGGLLLLIAVSPLQYMAGMVGPVWLTVTAIGLLVSRRGR